MPTRTSVAGGELFIVDNSQTEWKALRYLRDWCSISHGLDVASAYFEIGSLLGLDGEWQKVDKIRILLGDEVSLRTKRAFEAGVKQIMGRLDASLEAAKEDNDFLRGVPAIVEALRDGRIECRVYRRDKFHAKAYITHARMEVVGSSALVGSSNFTHPGLTKNIELNVQITGTPVGVLQEWYEEHWERAEDVTLEVLQTAQRQTREHSPFEVYAKSLQRLLEGEALSVTQWEQNDSQMFPKLAQYQRDAYGALLKKAETYGGAFLCDGVGLGKTYVGLALIERLVERDRQRVALFVPKAARESVWEQNLKEHLPDLYYGGEGFKLFSHTDLLREGEIAERLDHVRRRYDVIVIDEAHHFRNTGTRGDDPAQRQSRYWAMHDLCEGKQVYMLTATPVNNRLTDLQHMIELFSRDDPRRFSRLGVHSLRGHFRQMEKSLKERTPAHRDQAPDDADDPPQTNLAEAGQVLADDRLFQELVVQRSRAYVKENMKITEDGQAVFPKRLPPRVAHYSLKKVYGRLLDMVDEAFHKKKPLFSLPIYYPWEYYRGDPAHLDKWTTGRQKQIVQLIRTGFLKRLESSAAAFESSCWNLLMKLLAWVQVHSETTHERDRLEKWKARHAKLLQYEQHKQGDLFDPASLADQDEDVVPPELMEDVEPRSRDEFDVPGILADTYQDLDQILELLKEVQNVKPRNDSKLQALIKLLKTDPVLKEHKVLIFTEFMTTARYLERELKTAGIDGVDEVDSNRASSNKRGQIIRRFAPYYNGSSPAELENLFGTGETRVLISTDVLSEGLNLQDATRIINYDLHWNPVRLMQRIGRVDRRLNPDIERRIAAEHPERAAVRGDIAFWNFLPPDELNRLLSLYHTVTRKTLNISHTLGIEGGQLLTPEDDYKALRIFDEAYQGRESPIENMRNQLARLLADHPDLEAKLDALPGRAFSGKAHPNPAGTAVRGVFFCYDLPAHDELASREAHADRWTLDAGPVHWLYHDLATGDILENPAAIHDLIRCDPAEPRRCTLDAPTLTDLRKKTDKHLKNSYLRSVQAPLDAPKPKLIAWMELS